MAKDSKICRPERRLIDGLPITHGSRQKSHLGWGKCSWIMADDAGEFLDNFNGKVAGGRSAPSQIRWEHTSNLNKTF